MVESPFLTDTSISHIYSERSSEEGSKKTVRIRRLGGHYIKKTR